jgi:hypothetical protein
LGGFLEPIGPGAGARGLFSADGVLLVRWASGNFDFFRGFFTFLVRFLPVFRPYFALFPSMSCAYHYVNNFFSVSLAWNVLTSNRKGRKARKGGGGEQRTRNPEPGNRNGDGEAAGGGRVRELGNRNPARRAPTSNREKPEKGGERQRAGNACPRKSPQEPTTLLARLPCVRRKSIS